MTQPYGQQPGNYRQQPGGPQGGYPQAGGYQQPGSYPQSGGLPQPGMYPQAPGYVQGHGGLPQAPPAYGRAGTARPGTLIAAAVLAFVQAAITLSSTILLVTQANDAGEVTAFGWILILVQLAGALLLIIGGVQLIQGTSRVVLVVATGLELALCGFWLVAFATVSTFRIGDTESSKAMLILIALFFAIMPAIGLILALGGGTSQYLQSRRAN